MTRLLLWFSDHDTYEIVDTDDTGACITVMTEEGAELAGNGTTYKKMSEQERAECVVREIALSEILDFYEKHHPNCFDIDILDGSEDEGINGN